MRSNKLAFFSPSFLFYLSILQNLTFSLTGHFLFLFFNAEISATVPPWEGERAGRREGREMEEVVMGRKRRNQEKGRRRGQEGEEEERRWIEEDEWRKGGRKGQKEESNNSYSVM